MPLKSVPGISRQPLAPARINYQLSGNYLALVPGILKYLASAFTWQQHMRSTDPRYLVGSSRLVNTTLHIDPHQSPPHIGPNFPLLTLTGPPVYRPQSRQLALYKFGKRELLLFGRDCTAPVR